MDEQMRRVPRKGFAVIAAVLLLMVAFAIYNNYAEEKAKLGESELNSPDRSYAELTVELEGEQHLIVIELFEDKAPLTVSNFRHYVETGFYEGTVFHRIIKNFIVQGGGMDEEGNQKTVDRDPLRHEANDLRNRVGTVSMARLEGAHTATSQFFFNLQDNPSLNAGGVDQWGYVVFGLVRDPDQFSVIRQMSYVETDDSDQPLDNIVLVGARML